jgi:succinate-semialdehyde dehydrogenase/glutarate-semialdehyde dehydrogenase
MIKNLKNQALFKAQSYVNGVWVDAKDEKTYDVFNPASGELIAEVASLCVDDLKKAIKAAHEAFPKWAAMSAKERGKLIRKWADLVVANADDLAIIMTVEQGKPLAESKGEVLYAASFLEWYAEEGKRAYGDIIPSPINGARILVTKQPIGVCASITPWNFPSAMITRKAGPALAAGCTIVCKPAKDTPFSATALAVLAHEAGIPAGVFNVITSSQARAIGQEICENPLVRKLSFTGSTEIGKVLMQQSASTMKKLSLELGGNAPFIVFEDADLDAAVEGAIICKYRNAGQTCVCANRLFIQESIYDAFAEKYAAKVKAMKVGNGLDAGVNIGPMINEAAIEKTNEMVGDATGKGAKVLVGGKTHELGGCYFEPTVLTNVSADMLVAQDEIFGPIAPLFKFKDEADVIKKANDTNYGLAAYFYARDMARVWRVAEALEFGMVAVNTGVLSTEVAPFGGVKESGFGREGSKYGLDEYLEMKYILMAGLS